MNILAASEADIAELTRVEIESKKLSIPECIESFEIDYTLRFQRWQTYFQGISPQTSRPERSILKALSEDGKIIGYLAGHLTTRYNLDAEIQSLYVLKQNQRTGIGRKLLARFAGWLIEAKAKTLCAGINPENKYKSFYLKYGGQYVNKWWIFWPDTVQLLSRLTT